MSSTDLIARLPHPTDTLSFVQHGQGLVGWGRHAAMATTGPDAADEISEWFAQQAATFDVDDSIHSTGSGPVCFVSLGFSPDDESVAVIPRVVVASTHDGVFVTEIGQHTASTAAIAPRGFAGEIRYHDSALSAADFQSVVRAAIDRIAEGDIAKVVLAHGLTAMTEFPVDERELLTRLAENYPTCTTFAVDGLIGASPEMLISRRDRHISSRVLAGTAWPEHLNPGATNDIATGLLASDKDLREHRYAVDSVAQVLRPLASGLTVPDKPHALPLANLTHLATDITGTLADDDAKPSALDLAAALHPTAAVGGTPTTTAQHLIAELEPDLRGRYASPVGWIDTRGDGDFAIALRCAQLAHHRDDPRGGTTVRMMAGCGIVADSDPDTEAREAQIKMVPIRDALES